MEISKQSGAEPRENELNWLGHFLKLRSRQELNNQRSRESEFPELGHSGGGIFQGD